MRQGIGLAELTRSPKWPVRVRQGGATEKDEVDLFLTDCTVGYRRLTKVPGDADGNPDLPAHARAALHHSRDLCQRVFVHSVCIEAKAYISKVDAVVLHSSDREDCVVELYAVSMEIIGAEAYRQRQALGPDRANSIKRFQVEPQPACEVPAISVEAFVRERRKKAATKIAVRKVQLEPFETGCFGAASRIGVGFMERAYLVHREFVNGKL